MLVNNLEVNLLIKEQKWKNYRKNLKKEFQDFVERIVPQTFLQKYMKQNVLLVLNIVLTNDNDIKKINFEHRDVNKVTNVLSFPVIDFKSKEDLLLVEQNKFIILGDIIVTYDKIIIEAEKQKKEFQSHLYHLLVHSLLHLIGYDHKKEKEAKLMENLEIKILKTLDIKNPYLI
jgi:probable rRNA maturation factor